MLLLETSFVWMRVILFPAFFFLFFLGTSSDLSQTAENEEGDAAAVLCFGDHPGVEVVPCRSCDTPDNYYDYIFKIFNSPAER